MPVGSTHDNILHKILHDRFYSTKTAGEKAMLAMTLLAFANLQVLRQDISMRTEDIIRDIQLTESQMRLLGSSFDRYLQGLSKYSADDARVMSILGERLAALETRLQSTRTELVNAEQRFNGLLTTWATSRF